MFDFTTETILNDLSRVSVLTDTQDASLAIGEKALYIKRQNKYRSANVKNIFKSAGYNPVLEVAHVSVPASVAVGDLLRINIDVILSGSQNAEYTRWAVNKGKPFFVEYLVATASAVVDTHGPLIAAFANKALKKEGFSDIVISYNATSDKLEVTATNEYQRIVGASIEKYNAVTFEFDVVTTATIKTAGLEGFGTSWFLTKNIKLPTVENMRFMGEHQDELPIANSLYDQYSIFLESARNITGQGAVGQAMVSKTVHVIYVLSSLSSTFEALINDGLGNTKLKNAQTNAALYFSALADVVLSQVALSAATVVANTFVGSLDAYFADFNLATGVTFALVAGTGDTNNAGFAITGAQVRSVGAQTAGAKSIRVRATDANGSYTEVLTITVGA